jgi:hypothetical protein
MPLFICRWQNGDFSAVFAVSKERAIEMLDEVGNAENCDLFATKEFMVHFHLKRELGTIDGDLLPIELEGFGEGTSEMLFRRVYPVYDKLLSEVLDTTANASNSLSQEQRDAALKAANQGLTTGRNRHRGVKKTELSADAAVAELQEQLDYAESDG